MKGMCPTVLPYAAANSTLSISVPSSASAFELLTRFDTGQRCSRTNAASRSRPALRRL